MALNHTLRHEDIHGDTQREDVVEGNITAENLSALIKICASRKIWWLIEQPSTSKFFEYPDMEEALRQVPWMRLRTWMGAFGGPMPKPTILVGSVPKEFLVLAKAKPKGLQGGHGSKKVGKWVTGTKDLAGSAAYPWDFCTEVATCFGSTSMHPKLALEEQVEDHPWEFGYYNMLGGLRTRKVETSPGGVVEYKKHKAPKGNSFITDFFKQSV